MVCSLWLLWPRWWSLHLRRLHRPSSPQPARRSPRQLQLWLLRKEEWRDRWLPRLARKPKRTGSILSYLIPLTGVDFAIQVRRALELQGFQVVQTRQGNENPSFDDRSATANAQRGAVFVSLHISSTGMQGTARAYVNADLPPVAGSNGLIPWDRAQAPFLGLSKTFGDLVQGFLTQRFKGSPDAAQTASVRQLRTTAAPAIAVEISSVTVEDRAELDRMAPGVADAIARGAAAFKPSYIVPTTPGGLL